jgi:glucose/arabinose dehydrogenase
MQARCTRGTVLLLILLIARGMAGAQDTRLATDIPKIPAPNPNAAQVPDGYLVQVAFEGLMYPSSIDFDEAGNAYVAECGHFPGDDTKPARILKLGPSGDRQVVASGLNAPITDVLWHEGRLYVSHRGKISVLEGNAVRDLVTDLPSLGDHSNNQMAIAPDGKLYFGQGSATNSGVVGVDNFMFGWPQKHPEVSEVPAKDIVLAGHDFESPDPRPGAKGLVKTSAFHPFGTTAPADTVVKGRTKANGTVLRMALDGSGLEMYAWGFRNPYGICWAGGKLFVADAGSDERGSRHLAHTPEKLWQAKQDAWYGWPDYEGGVPVTDERHRPKSAPPPKFVMKEHPPVEKPFLTFEEHASITQMDVAPAAFGFEGHVFIGASGDQTPVTAPEVGRAGYWVKRFDPASGTVEPFFRTRPDALGAKSLEYVSTAGPKRIVDVRFSRRDGALYVVDIGPLQFVAGEKGPKPIPFPGTGVIWRVSRARSE